jgi:hypothetical protein
LIIPSRVEALVERPIASSRSSQLNGRINGGFNHNTWFIRIVLF